MTFAKLHDTFHAHAKVARLESGPCYAEAIALWVMTLSWCSAQMSDGTIERHLVRKMVPFAWEQAASELVRVGLWVESADGFAFHEWDSHQDSVHRVARRREQNRKAQAKSRELKRHPLTSAPVIADVSKCQHDNIREGKGIELKRDAREAVASPMDTERTIERRFSEARQRATLAKNGRPGGGYRRGPRDYEAMQSAAAFFSGSAEAEIVDSLAGYMGNEWATGANWPFGTWANDPGKYQGQIGPLQALGWAAKLAELEGAYHEAHGEYLASEGTERAKPLMAKVRSIRDAIAAAREVMP